METRNLGSLAVSVVGLGCNNFGTRIDQDRTTAVVDAAVDAGITLFDTADIYGGTQSEVFLGIALGDRRDDVIVATKWGMGTESGAGRPRYVRACCDASLGRLGTDRIDLFQMHVPDAGTPITETLGALDELIAEGKVREIGCSNFDSRLVAEAASVSDASGGARFVSVQNHLNLLDRRQEADTIAAATEHGLGVLPYFPLASGLLTGKYRRDAAAPEGTRLAGLSDERRDAVMGEATFEVVERLDAFATDRGHTLLELAVSWLAGLPAMGSVISGATRADQVDANVAAVGWSLTDADRGEIDRLTART